MHNPHFSTPHRTTLDSCSFGSAAILWVITFVPEVLSHQACSSCGPDNLSIWQHRLSSRGVFCPLICFLFHILRFLLCRLNWWRRRFFLLKLSLAYGLRRLAWNALCIRRSITAWERLSRNVTFADILIDFKRSPVLCMEFSCTGAIFKRKVFLWITRFLHSYRIWEGFFSYLLR